MLPSQEGWGQFKILCYWKQKCDNKHDFRFGNVFYLAWFLFIRKMK